MSAVSGILSGRVKVRRPTSFLLDSATVAATMAFTRQPAQEVFLEAVAVGGTITAGAITVAGSTTEVLSFTASGMQRSTRYYTSLTDLTLTGFDGSTLSIRAINSMGQPVTQENVAFNSVNVRFYAQGGRIFIQKPGPVVPGAFRVMAEPDSDIRENDIVEVLSGVTGMTAGRVVRCDRLFDFAGVTHHAEIELIDIH
jgi:hypothetical protein